MARDAETRINELLTANNVLVDRVRVARAALRKLDDWRLSGDEMSVIIDTALRQSGPK